MGALAATRCFSSLTSEDVLDRYDEGRKVVKPISQVDNNQKAAFTFLHVAETKEQAIASRAAEAAMWYVNAAPRIFAHPARSGPT